MKPTYINLLLFLLILSSCTKTDEDTVEEYEEVQTELSRPNILLIIADDMGLDATPGYSIGETKPNMPNLVSMMNNGIRFTNLWSSPLCTPTRAGIITGKYGFRTGVTNVGNTLSSSEQSIHSYLDNMNSGYSHAVIGKWHLSNRDVNHPNNIGVDEYAGILGGGVQSYFNWDLVENMQSSNSAEYTTSKLTDLAINWVESQTDPWFLWLAYNAPHTPFHLPPNNLHSQGVLSDSQARIDANPLPYYLAMLEALDSEMGRLLNAMSQEEKENTVVIFIGDNGTPNQVVQTYSSRRAKGSLYQGGINVPMVISGKNVTRKGVEEPALLSTIDLFATIAEIAGADLSEINDSKNFTSMFNIPGITVRDFAYAEIGDDINSISYSIREESYKLIRFSDGDEAFFNLEEDPLELTNLLSPNRLPLSNVTAVAKQKLEDELARIKQ